MCRLSNSESRGIWASDGPRRCWTHRNFKRSADKETLMTEVIMAHLACVCMWQTRWEPSDHQHSEHLKINQNTFKQTHVSAATKELLNLFFFTQLNWEINEMFITPIWADWLLMLVWKTSICVSLDLGIFWKKELEEVQVQSNICETQSLSWIMSRITLKHLKSHALVMRSAESESKRLDEEAPGQTRRSAGFACEQSL